MFLLDFIANTNFHYEKQTFLLHTQILIMECCKFYSNQQILLWRAIIFIDITKSHYKKQLFLLLTVNFIVVFPKFIIKLKITIIISTKLKMIFYIVTTRRTEIYL